MSHNLVTDYNSRGVVANGYMARRRAAQERADERAAQNADPKVIAIRRVRAALIAVGSVEQEASRVHELENRPSACPITGRPGTLHPSARDRLIAILNAHAPDLLGIGDRPLDGLESLDSRIERMTVDARRELEEANAAVAALDAGEAPAALKVRK